MGNIRLRVELRALRHAISELQGAMEKHSEAVHTAQEARNKDNAIPKPVPVTVSYSEQANAGQNRQNTTQEEIAKWTKRAVYAAIFYATIAAVQWCEMHRATIAATDAAKTASETLHIAYRPRVSILGVTQDAMLDKGRIRVTFTAPNFGPVPANNVRIFVFDNVSPHDTAVRLPYRAELPDYSKTILPKGQSGDGYAVFGNRVISPTELDKLKAGTLWITFSILIQYEDDFSITHHAETCSLFTLQPYNSICPWPVRND